MGVSVLAKYRNLQRAAAWLGRRVGVFRVRYITEESVTLLPEVTSGTAQAAFRWVSDSVGAFQMEAPPLLTNTLSWALSWDCRAYCRGHCRDTVVTHRSMTANLI